MDHRKKLKEYIDETGGVTAAAPVIGCAKITLWKVLSGRGGIGKEIAEKLESASAGKLKYGDILRIKPTIKQPPAKDKPRKARARGRK